MNRQFGGGQREDQPPVARIDCRHFKHVAKEGEVCFHVAAVDQEMHAKEHDGIVIAPRRKRALNTLLIRGRAHFRSASKPCPDVKNRVRQTLSCNDLNVVLRGRYAHRCRTLH